MNGIKSLLITAATLASAATAQKCELYYKFDRGVGDTAVNYGNANVDSKIVSMTTTPWAATGQHDRSLQGSDNTSATDYNYCDTGWDAAVTKDFTVSWWSSQRVAPGTALSSVFGGKGDFRCFTNGAAGSELSCRAWGGIDLQLPTSGATFQARAAAPGGVSVALVVDSSLGCAFWYVDGAPHGNPITITAAVNIPNGNFIIGKHTSNTSSFAYDIDEFRFCTYPAQPTEIKAWHKLPHAATGTIGAPCGIELRPSGAPTSGNPLFALDFKAGSAFKYLFVAGLKPAAGFDMGIAFPALAGCTWYSDFTVEFVGSSTSGGATVPIPIPATVFGASFDAQVLGFDRAGTALMSNALSTKIEKQ